MNPKEPTIREILKKYIPHCQDITCGCYKPIDLAHQEILRKLPSELDIIKAMDRKMYKHNNDNESERYDLGETLCADDIDNIARAIHNLLIERIK